MVALYLIGLSFWLYHQFIRRHQLKKSAYQVTENRVENSMVRSLHLKPSQGPVFAYKPGQFTFISVQNGQVSNEPRPYTIASSPSDPNEIEFVIKKPEEFAQQLDLIQPGDEVHVNAPFGVFSYLNYPEENELVFIAGGIGITPFLSMLRWMKDKDPQRKVILLWGCRFQEDVIKKEEFEAMAAAMPNFTWCPVLSDEAEFKGETGYFDTDKLNRLAVSKIDVQTAGFYVCAPPAMMDIVGVSLEELGVPSKHIHYESFSI
jgi:ferredoxin-NADP reductase